MASVALRVIKLGGSLLELPSLHLRLLEWLDQQPSGPACWVVGGGKVVDAVRELDDIHHFSSQAVHWSCVELMEHTSRWLHLLLPNWRLIQDYETLANWIVDAQGNAQAIVTPSSYYSRSLNADRLPIGWQTTSDSIAFLLAELVGAEECVLLKSVSAAGDDLRQWEDQQIVDPVFRSLASGSNMSLRVVNLRSFGDDDDLGWIKV